MPRLPLGLAAYQRLDLPPVYLRNLFYERAPANQKDQVALISRPALSRFITAGVGPIRGLFQKSGSISNRRLAVSGTQLYRLPDAGSAVLVGAIEGTGRMSAEGNTSAVLLTLGTKLYTTDGASVSQVTFPDSRNVYAVDYLNSRFLAATTDGRYYFSDPNTTTFGALDYFTAEAKPDEMMSLKVSGDEIWLFGKASIEVWTPTTDADAPFQRSSGRTFGAGVLARDTIQKIDVLDALIWVGGDKRVYDNSQGAPRIISDATVEERIAASSDLTALYAFTYAALGHQFYILQIPGEGTFAYDLTTKLWGELTSYGQSLFRVQTAITADDGRTFLGDIASNQVWTLDDADELDGEDPILYEFTGLVQGPAPCNSIKLDGSVGTALDPESDPMMQLRISDDDGRTWDDWLSEPLGRIGEYRARPAWGRLGRIEDRRLFHFRTTKRGTWRGADMNEGLR